MLLGFLFSVMLLFTAVALIVFGITPDATLWYLAKLIAIDIGAAILVVFAWPYIRGVRKGDNVIVAEESTKGKIMMLFGVFNGKALDDGKIGSVIKVELFDGSVGLATITKYEGLFSNAEVKLLERTIPVEIKG